MHCLVASASGCRVRGLWRAILQQIQNKQKNLPDYGVLEFHTIIFIQPFSSLVPSSFPCRPETTSTSSHMSISVSSRPCLPSIYSTCPSASVECIKRSSYFVSSTCLLTLLRFVTPVTGFGRNPPFLACFDCPSPPPSRRASKTCFPSSLK